MFGHLCWLKLKWWVIESSAINRANHQQFNQKWKAPFVKASLHHEPVTSDPPNTHFPRKVLTASLQPSWTQSRPSSSSHTRPHTRCDPGQGCIHHCLTWCQRSEPKAPLALKPPPLILCVWDSSFSLWPLVRTKGMCTTVGFKWNVNQKRKPAQTLLLTVLLSPLTACFHSRTSSCWT